MDVCLTGLVGDLRDWTRWSRRDQRRIFRACGLYGGSAETICGDDQPMGICCDVWGNASGVWLYGETAIPYGEAAHVWGGRGIAWRTKVA